MREKNVRCFREGRIGKYVDRRKETRQSPSGQDSQGSGSTGTAVPPVIPVPGYDAGADKAERRAIDAIMAEYAL